MKTIEVVAAVIQDGPEVLCTQRGANKLPYIHLKWEFPGGKIEEGEDHATALAREIREELKVEVQVLERLEKVDHVYPDFRLIMHPYRCAFAEPGGRERLTLTEHHAAAWMKPASTEFQELDWAAADVPIVKQLLTSQS